MTVVEGRHSSKWLGRLEFGRETAYAKNLKIFKEYISKKVKFHFLQNIPITLYFLRERIFKKLVLQENFTYFQFYRRRKFGNTYFTQHDFIAWRKSDYFIKSIQNRVPYLNNSRRFSKIDNSPTRYYSDSRSAVHRRVGVGMVGAWLDPVAVAVVVVVEASAASRSSSPAAAFRFYSLHFAAD